MSAEPEKKERGSILAPLAAVFVGLPVLSLCISTFVGPPSIETVFFSLFVFLFVFHGLRAARNRRRASLAWASAGLALLVVLFRLVVVGGNERISFRTAPMGGAPRWIDRILPERDVALGTTAILTALGAFGGNEEGLMPALRDGYARMEASDGRLPSPLLGTYLLGQSPDDHQMIRLSPRRRTSGPMAAVVFLHGSAGSTTQSCWQVARAPLTLGMDVLCPSTDFTGQWARRDGPATARRAVESLRENGVRRVYLAGLSAGAIGASRLANDLPIEGLILISGAASNAPPARRPTLILQGGRDPRTPPAPGRRLARISGGSADYREVEEANHWLLLSHHEWVQEQIFEWLEARSATRR